MLRRRLRRGSGAPEHASEEGPFVSFTDLFIGILFLFLILVAALMLMHQAAVKRAEEEARRLQAHRRGGRAAAITCWTPWMQPKPRSSGPTSRRRR